MALSPQLSFQILVQIFQQLVLVFSPSLMNLLPSSIIPKAVNGAEMHPVNRLPVCFKTGNKELAHLP